MMTMRIVLNLVGVFDLSHSFAMTVGRCIRYSIASVSSHRNMWSNDSGCKWQWGQIGSCQCCPPALAFRAGVASWLYMSLVRWFGVATLYFRIACLNHSHCIMFDVSGIQLFLLWRYILRAGIVADSLKLLLYSEWIDSDSLYTMHRLAGKNGANGSCVMLFLRKLRVCSRVSATDCSRLNGGGVCCRCFFRYVMIVSHLILICACLISEYVCSRISQLFARVALQKSVGYVGRLCK